MSKKVDTSREERITRDDDTREEFVMNYSSPLAIVDRFKEDGMDYRWARRSTQGQDDFRIEELSLQGWTPVPASKAPKFTADPLNRNPLSKEFITYKDTLLMQRPSKYSNYEREQLKLKNRDQIRNLRGVSDDYATPRFSAIR